MLEKEILEIKDIKEAEAYTLYVNSECEYFIPEMEAIIVSFCLVYQKFISWDLRILILI